jgi:hypothetical protein
MTGRNRAPKSAARRQRDSLHELPRHRRWSCHGHEEPEKTVHLAPNAQVSLYPWKDTADKIPLTVRHIRTFLRAHRPVAAAQSMAAAAL